MDWHLVNRGLKNPEKVIPYLVSLPSDWWQTFKWKQVASGGGLVEKDVNGWEVFLDPKDYEISRKIYFDGEYSKDIGDVINNRLNEGEVAVDIGAQIGYFTLHMAKCVSNTGHVKSFEPHPRNFEILLKNVQNNGYKGVVSAHQFAITDNSGTGQLNTHPDNKGMHSIVNNYESNSIEIELERGDDQVPNNVDLIKIDVEGAEPSVFMGLKNTITDCKPDIIFEYDERLWESDSDEALSMLDDIGYEFATVEEPTQKLSANEVIEDIVRDNLVAEVTDTTS